MSEIVRKTADGAVSAESARTLAEMILNGSASEEERGVFLRTVQTAMGAGLMAQVQRLHSIMTCGMDVYQMLDSRYLEKLQEDLDQDVLTAEDIAHERNGIERRLFNLMHLERQIMQGKSLFPEDTLSNDDRKVLRVLSTIKTEEDRSRFFDMLDSFLAGNNAFDAPEPSVAPGPEYNAPDSQFE